MSLDPNWISATVAAIAVGFSFWAQRTAEKARDRADALAHQNWSDEYFREITAWASSVCMAISEAIHLDVNDDRQRRAILVRLSASIDMGRWYFPNLHHETEGQHKEPAYRGLRQPCLDWTVLAYDIVAENRVVSDRKAALVECQRQFVSCIQEKLNPRLRERAIKHVLDEFGVVSKLPKVQSPP